ncbi:hypothetical protein DCAR_0207200 [Daucus carota subsp. sativus]|uniref:K Homology domain-containing protein n=1 Tax=Daucus carota subsp. sativus TaxID=79200 RepID=A0AAF0WDJ2_DAUCS|nr:hypothetical protein DCAR_0207200 [Daucus carota subsp. sativus]
MQSSDSVADNISPRHIESSLGTSHHTNFKQSNEVSYLKFLVSNAEAGAVIGKGGSIISDLRLQSETFIQLSNNYEFFPGTANRIILVSGQIDCVIKAVELILEKFRNETYDAEGKDEPSSKVRLVVPYSCCGAIIGRRGSTIKSFVELSQAGIRISSPKDLYAGLSDRLVTVVGTISEQMRAIDLILLKLSGNPYYTQSMNVPFSYAGYNVVHYYAVGAKMFNNMYQSNYRQNKEGEGNSVTIGVADEHIGLVLGRGGRNLRRISQISEARIKVSNRNDFISGTTDRKVTITGSERAICVAEDMIMRKLDSAVEHH